MVKIKVTNNSQGAKKKGNQSLNNKCFSLDLDNSSDSDSFIVAGKSFQTLTAATKIPLSFF